MDVWRQLGATELGVLTENQLEPDRLGAPNDVSWELVRISRQAGDAPSFRFPAPGDSPDCHELKMAAVTRATEDPEIGRPDLLCALG